jgi:hypothetical protein
MCILRRVLVCALAVMMMLPAPLLAADTKAAMVYARGTAWVNGLNIPRSSAIFVGDLVQTKTDSVANINTSGSSVSVFADSLVRFEGEAVQLEHGGVRVATSKSFSTRAGDVTIAPISPGMTEFQVVDVDGTVKIIARKGDVSISDTTGTSTLPAGQETSRDETQSTGRRRKGPATPTAAQGGLLDSRTALYGGLGAITGVGIWLILQGDDPVSPDH